MQYNPYECNKVPATTSCKCCDQIANLAGLVDFSRCGADIDAGKKIDPYAGWPIYYYQCTACSFTFTRAFDQWRYTDFANYIYNEDYARHDPAYLGDRPRSCADMILTNFGSFKSEIALLDYGSGQGLMGEILAHSGFSSVMSFDPFSSAKRPDRQFNMVTCFEVFEHVHDPVALLKDIDSFLSPDGVVLFSTFLCPQEVVDGGLHNWWYCVPRNGHISFYAPASLRAIADQFGLKLHSFDQSLHVMYRPNIATWLKPLLPPLNG